MNKVKSDYSLWIAILIMSLILWGGYTILKQEANLKHIERMKELRDTYSPMSDDAEIQRAYDEIK